jgi:hypothetical protein
MGFLIWRSFATADHFDFVIFLIMATLCPGARLRLPNWLAKSARFLDGFICDCDRAKVTDNAVSSYDMDHYHNHRQKPICTMSQERF